MSRDIPDARDVLAEIKKALEYFKQRGKYNPIMEVAFDELSDEEDTGYGRSLAGSTCYAGDSKLNLDRRFMIQVIKLEE